MPDQPTARPVLPSTTTPEIARHVLARKGLASGDAPAKLIKDVIDLVDYLGREDFLALVMPYIDAAELARDTPGPQHGIHLLQAIAEQPIA